MSSPTRCHRQYGEASSADYLTYIGLPAGIAAHVLSTEQSIARFNDDSAQHVAKINYCLEELQCTWCWANYYEYMVDDLILDLRRTESRNNQQAETLRQERYHLVPSDVGLQQEDYNTSIDSIRDALIKAAEERSRMESLKKFLCLRITMSIRLRAFTHFLHPSSNLFSLMQGLSTEIEWWNRTACIAVSNRQRFDACAESARGLSRSYRRDWYRDLQESGAFWSDKLPRYSGPAPSDLRALPDYTGSIQAWRNTHPNSYRYMSVLSGESRPDSPADPGSPRISIFSAELSSPTESVSSTQSEFH